MFGLVNAYSLASDPIAWFKGVVTPFFDHLVPAGEGWVALSDFLGRGGGNLTYYTFLVLAVTIFCIVIFVYIYPRAKSLLVFFPSIVLFFASRSYSNYLVMLLLPALVTFTSVRPSPPSSVSLLGTLFSTRRRYVVLASAALIPLVALIITVTPQPLTLNINSVTTTGQLATVIEVQLVATNHTGQRITPVFASESGGAITAPWDVVQGPSSLAPHAHAVYALQAPNFFAQPSLTGGFQIVALTTTPEALSVSGPYVPTRLHVNLNPESFDRPLAAGSTITIQAQVLTPTNAPLQKSGIPVYLGQVSYTQQGLIFTQASINGSPVGATPVEAPTNRQGVATFNITDLTASHNPVYFEANLVDQVSSYPYGYSNIVTARFR